MSPPSRKNLSAFRIIQPQHVARAMDGEGARLHPGRWNPPGTPMVYLAGSRALAALEILVHLDGPARRMPMAVIEVRFDPAMISQPPALPRNWLHSPPIEATRTIGGDWAASRASLILEVPSAILPEESNFLLNPLHPDAGWPSLGEPHPFSLDPRLA